MPTPWNKIYCTRCVSLIPFDPLLKTVDILWEDTPPLPTAVLPLSPLKKKEAPLKEAPPPVPATLPPLAPPKITLPKRPRKKKGLLRYRKWWFYRPVGICVNGKLLRGTPIFLKDGTLRMVNSAYSYFIPMERIDYIRTPDGLDAAEGHFLAPNNARSV